MSKERDLHIRLGDRQREETRPILDKVRGTTIRPKVPDTGERAN